MIAGLLRLMDVDMGDNIDTLNHEDLDVVNLRGRLFVEYVQNKSDRLPSEAWGFKYPHLLDFYEECINLLVQCKLIFVFRDFFAVAQSYEKYHLIPIHNAVLDASSRYSRLTSMYWSLHPNSIAISYEKALLDKRKIIEDIISFAQVEVSEEKIAECMNFITPGTYKSIDTKQRSS